MNHRSSSTLADLKGGNASGGDRNLPESGGPPGSDPPGQGASSLISVIVPVTERPSDLADLYEEYSEPFRDEGWNYEFLFVLEPWFRHLAEPLEALQEADHPIEVLQVGQGRSEGTLLKLAAEKCEGEVLVTLPAYHRVRAETLPELIRRLESGADLAVAYRSPRRDSWVNRIQTRAFHLVLHWLTGERVRDVACGVRAMRRKVLLTIPLYGDFFRFLPILAKREGFQVAELAGTQHPADQDTRVYNPGIYLRRLIDLLGIFFMLRFTYKPLRFFGLIGSGFSMVGAVVLFVLFLQRIGGQGIANRPMLLLGVLLLTLGIQAIALGLVGEIIVHLNAPSKRSYRVRKTADGPAEETAP